MTPGRIAMPDFDGCCPPRRRKRFATIDKLEFAPAEVNAKVGDTIEWVNKDALVHWRPRRTKIGMSTLHLINRAAC